MEKAHLFVLAGGLGTRLRPAVSDVPKALAPVHGKPFLFYQVKNWLDQGIARMSFLVHYQSEMIEGALNQLKETGAFKNCVVDVIREEQLLGTGGAVAHGIRTCGTSTPFLVTNADTWLGTGIQKIAQATTNTIAAVKVPDVGRYGSLNIEGDQVMRFEEKFARTGEGWINAGLYRLNPSEVLNARAPDEAFSLERDLFPILASEKRLHAVPLETSFIDIGIPEDYFRFCEWVSAGSRGNL